MATTHHLEVEAKYDLAEGDPVPDLLGVAGVAQVHDLTPQVLTATYYDTADLALQRHRITLRRRTGGSDDGWHLKLPVTGGERLELRRPPGTRAAVPLPLRRLLVTVLADRRLVPVATLVTRRATSHLVGSDGTVLAELADDLVTVERDGADAVRWRELEIELVEGGPDVLVGLDEAVRGSGLRRSASSSKIGRVLTGPSAAPVAWGLRLRTRRAAVELLTETATALRVLDATARAGRAGAAAGLASGVRRRRAAVDLARRLGVVGDDDGRSFVAELTWAVQALEPAAALDDAVELVRETVAAQPAELVLGPVARRLDREVAARRRSDQTSLTDLLGSSRWQQLVAGDEPGQVLGGGQGQRLGKALPDLTRWAGRRLERGVQDLEASGLDAAGAGSSGPGSSRLQASGLGSSGPAPDDRLASARRAASTALLAEEVAARAGLRPTGSAGSVGSTAALLDRLAPVAGALDLARAAGVAAHLAGENGFTFGRVHGLLAAEAAAVGRELQAEREALRRGRKERR